MKQPSGVEVILQASKKYMSPETWAKLWDSPIRTILDLVFADGPKPESCYSRRWLPKARFDATVFQTTRGLEVAAFVSLRKVCSQHGVFAHRKREEVPEEFIAWLPTETSLSEARAQQQRHDSQVHGLICVKDKLQPTSLPKVTSSRL